VTFSGGAFGSTDLFNPVTGLVLAPTDFTGYTGTVFPDGLYKLVYAVYVSATVYSKTLYVGIFNDLKDRISNYQGNIAIPIIDLPASRTAYAINFLLDCATDAASVGNTTNYTTIMNYLKELLVSKGL
jgi:hypothetical protein